MMNLMCSDAMWSISPSYPASCTLSVNRSSTEMLSNYLGKTQPQDTGNLKGSVNKSILSACLLYQRLTAIVPAYI